MDANPKLISPVLDTEVTKVTKVTFHCRMEMTRGRSSVEYCAAEMRARLNQKSLRDKIGEEIGAHWYP